MSFAKLFEKTEKGAPLVLPLRSFYAGEPAQEIRRRQFYRLMAAEFDWPGWKKPAKVERKAPGKAGRDGRQRDIVIGSRKNPADRDARVSAAEFFQGCALLNDPTTILAPDREKRLAEQYGDIRRSVARQIVANHEGANAGALQSPDWMKEGGGGGGRPMTPAEGRLWCAQALNEMRAAMPPEEAATIDRVILRDEFIWEVDSIEARKLILEDIRLALDFAALAWGLISFDRMRRRWEKFRHFNILRPAIDRARRAKAEDIRKAERSAERQSDPA